MTTTYRITGYGDTVEFESLEDAQRTVRSCGDAFAHVTLRVAGAERGDDPEIIGRIRNERGESVGEVVEA